MESGILDFEILKSGIQLKEFGIPLTIVRVRHSRSTDNESEIQHLGSGLHNVESRILICGALTICMEKPEIPGRIQMERFIPFAVLPFTRSYLLPVLPVFGAKKNTNTI